jgi:hypothetical protein
MSSTCIGRRVNASRAVVYRALLDARAVATWMVWRKHDTAHPLWPGSDTSQLLLLRVTQRVRILLWASHEVAMNRRMILPPAAWLLTGAVAAPLVGCVADTYCQSGPKYGTHCYSGWDVRDQQRRQGRTQESGSWWNQSAPATATRPSQPSTHSAPMSQRPPPTPSAATRAAAPPPSAAPRSEGTMAPTSGGAAE